MKLQAPRALSLFLKHTRTRIDGGNYFLSSFVFVRTMYVARVLNTSVVKKSRALNVVLKQALRKILVCQVSTVVHAGKVSPI